MQIRHNRCHKQKNGYYQFLPSVCSLCKVPLQSSIPTQISLGVVALNILPADYSQVGDELHFHKWSPTYSAKLQLDD